MVPPGAGSPKVPLCCAHAMAISTSSRPSRRYYRGLLDVLLVAGGHGVLGLAPSYPGRGLGGNLVPQE